MTATPIAISIEDVTKTFRVFHQRNRSLKAAAIHRRRAQFEEFIALDHVSLAISAGECFAFIGHNGSGKSTLLKCIAGILQPDSGRVSVVGSISALLELGAGFHPELSGRENIFLNGALLGVSQRVLRQKLDDIVSFAGLEQFIDHPVKNYSSGMYARLGFAVAINVDPDVLLIDEVLSVGDEEFQRRSMEKIYDLRSSGKTVVIVSHGIGVLRTLCDRAAWLNHGELSALGGASEVVDAYVEATGQKMAQATAGESEIFDDASRTGSGEIQVERVEIIGPADRAHDQLHTGDPTTFRLHWFARDSVYSPVFGAAIRRTDGVLVSASNTKIGGHELGVVRGRGSVEMRVESLALLPGEYTIETGVFDPTCTHQYDHRVKAARFVVGPGADRGVEGVVTLHGQWTSRS